MDPSKRPNTTSEPKEAVELAYVEQLGPQAERLSHEDKDFLLARHGTLDLTPFPSADLQDPLNWPGWKKDVFLGLVTFQAMMSTFGAAAVVPAFEALSREYGRSVPTISYL